MTDANRQAERLLKLADKGIGDDKSLDIVPDHFVDLAANHFRATELSEHRHLVGSLAGTKTEDTQFEEGSFSAVDLSKTRWHNLLLREIRLNRCDVANARWTNAVLDNIQMEKCRGTGLQLIDSKSSKSAFLHSKLNLAAFHGSTLNSVRFESCDLSEANFESVQLVNVVFRNCDLRLSRFPNCALRNVDFRGSFVAGMLIEPEKLRGVCADASQLPDFAATLGMVVKGIGEDPE